MTYRHRKLRRWHNSVFWAIVIPTVIYELQITPAKLFHWFDNNHMKANPGKCHLLLGCEIPQVVYVSGATITSSTARRFLGIIILLASPFKAWCPIKCHIYISKVCVTFEWTPVTKELTLNIIFLPCTTK